MKARVLLALILAVALPAAPAPAQPAEVPPVMVHLADGTSQPLRAWSLTYDYLSSKQGMAAVLARPSQKRSADLWAGKKTYPLTGATLELSYREVPKEIEVAGRSQGVLIQVARKLTLQTADGKRIELAVEPPHRDLVIPGAEKSTSYVPRSLDLVGETLTGTKRTFCVLSYSALVECATAPSEQVVKLSFQQ